MVLQIGGNQIFHVAELLQLDRGVDVQVQTTAVYALDAIGRYRSKILPGRD